MGSGAALTAQNPSVSFDRVQDEEFSIEGTIREMRWPDEGHQAGGRIIAILAGKSLSVLGRCETPLREEGKAVSNPTLIGKTPRTFTQP